MKQTERHVRENELATNKQRELAKYATTLGIKGSHDLKKAELIEAILEAEYTSVCVNEKSAGDKNKVDNQDTEVANKSEKEVTSDIDEQKLWYIENAKPGTIVAFMVNRKAKSAMIMKKSTKKRRFMLETKYGVQYIVPYNDIIWVRTGNKWPRGVYNLLKGIEVSGNEKAGE